MPVVWEGLLDCAVAADEKRHNTGEEEMVLKKLGWLVMGLVMLLGGCASMGIGGPKHKFAIHAADSDRRAGTRSMVDKHSGMTLWVDKEAVVTEANISNAELVLTPNLEPAVKLTLDEKGTQALAELTRSQFGLPLAILIDDQLRLAPMVREVVQDGQVGLTGFDSITEADELVRDWQP